MDIHAHCTRNEVIGLLLGRVREEIAVGAGAGGGTADANAEGGSTAPFSAPPAVHTTVTVELALPAHPAEEMIDAARSQRNVNVEADALSQFAVVSLAESLGLRVVGWYHSHPTFQPDPSLVDCTGMRSRQEQDKQTLASARERGGAADPGLVRVDAGAGSHCHPSHGASAPSLASSSSSSSCYAPDHFFGVTPREEAYVAAIVSPFLPGSPSPMSEWRWWHTVTTEEDAGREFGLARGLAKEHAVPVPMELLVSHERYLRVGVAAQDFVGERGIGGAARPTSASSGSTHELTPWLLDPPFAVADGEGAGLVLDLAAFEAPALCLAEDALLRAGHVVRVPGLAELGARAAQAVAETAASLAAAAASAGSNGDVVMAEAPPLPLPGPLSSWPWNLLPSALPSLTADVMPSAPKRKRGASTEPTVGQAAMLPDIFGPSFSVPSSAPAGEQGAGAGKARRKDGAGTGGSSSSSGSLVPWLPLPAFSLFPFPPEDGDGPASAGSQAISVGASSSASAESSSAASRFLRALPLLSRGLLPSSAGRVHASALNLRLCERDVDPSEGRGWAGFFLPKPTLPVLRPVSRAISVGEAWATSNQARLSGVVGTSAGAGAGAGAEEGAEAEADVGAPRDDDVDMSAQPPGAGADDADAAVGPPSAKRLRPARKPPKKGGDAKGSAPASTPVYPSLLHACAATLKPDRQIAVKGESHIFDRGDELFVVSRAVARSAAAMILLARYGPEASWVIAVCVDICEYYRAWGERMDLAGSPWRGDALFPGSTLTVSAGPAGGSDTAGGAAGGASSSAPSPTSWRLRSATLLDKLLASIRPHVTLLPLDLNKRTALLADLKAYIAMAWGR
jgi:hypothetical protein